MHKACRSHAEKSRRLLRPVQFKQVGESSYCNFSLQLLTATSYCNFLPPLLVLLQLLVLRLRLFQHGDIRIGILPGGKEILVG